MSVPRRIPGPPRSTSLANFARFRRDPIKVLRSMASEYGDISSITMAGQRLVLVNHPDLIHDILVKDQRNFVKGRGLERAKILLGEGLLTSEGDFHLQQRRMIQPAFHRQRINDYGRVMAGITRRAADKWPDGCTIDIAEEAANITMTIVAKTLFDADVESETNEIATALTDALGLFNVLSLPFAKMLVKLPLPSVVRFRGARERLDATIYKMIEDRRGGEDRGDLLSMLLAARDEEDPEARMSDVQIRDEAMTLFLAGHETTANSLAWTLYLIYQHLDVEAQVMKEIKTVLGARLPTVDDLANLPYTRQVISESLRLYPPGWIIARRALEDYPIGDYMIEKDNIALLAPVVMHVDERYWPEPLKFDPDRWAQEDADRPKFAYFPFGSGPRVCIGEQFAWMELMLVLVTLMQQWHFTVIPGHPVHAKPIITLRPSEGILLRLKRRGAKSAAAKAEEVVQST